MAAERAGPAGARAAAGTGAGAGGAGRGGAGGSARLAPSMSFSDSSATFLLNEVPAPVPAPVPGGDRARGAAVGLGGSCAPRGGDGARGGCASGGGRARCGVHARCGGCCAAPRPFVPRCRHRSRRPPVPPPPGRYRRDRDQAGRESRYPRPGTPRGPMLQAGGGCMGGSCWRGGWRCCTGGPHWGDGGVVLGGRTGMLRSRTGDAGGWGMLGARGAVTMLGGPCWGGHVGGGHAGKPFCLRGGLRGGPGSPRCERGGMCRLAGGRCWAAALSSARRGPGGLGGGGAQPHPGTYKYFTAASAPVPGAAGGG